jgi:hypothetical protein
LEVLPLIGEEISVDQLLEAAECGSGKLLSTCLAASSFLNFPTTELASSRGLCETPTLRHPNPDSRDPFIELALLNAKGIRL